jgi:hypothetical protein
MSAEAPANFAVLGIIMISVLVVAIAAVERMNEMNRALDISINNQQSHLHAEAEPITLQTHDSLQESR